MSTGQNNPGSNQNNQGNDGGKGSNPNDQNNQNRMGMPGGMHGGPMGFQPGMMNYGMPNFMSHLSAGGIPNQHMPYGMYQQNPQMMGQDGGNQQKMQNQPNQKPSGQQDGYKQGGNQDRPNKSQDPKDQSKLQGEAKNSQLEKRVPKSEGEGKRMDENALAKNPSNNHDDDEEDDEGLEKQGEALKRIEKHNQARRDAKDESRDDQNHGNEGEDEDGKYNLRRRTRKENPYYYCELSDDEGKPEGSRKKAKKYEGDYDPDQDESNPTHNKSYGKQGGQSQMNQPGMDQNYMAGQMMMQHMAGRNPMMNMPNLNETSGNMNPMMGYGQNPNAMMNSGMGRMQEQMSGGNPMGQQNYNQSSMQPQMNQNDPSKQVSPTVKFPLFKVVVPRRMLVITLKLERPKNVELLSKSIRP